jgi:hypothetical protein
MGNDFVCGRYRQMGGRARNTLFRLCAEDGEVNCPYIRQIQNALRRVAAFNAC